MIDMAYGMGPMTLGQRAENHRTVRPGRKLGAEKRRVARQILRDFYASEQFELLPRQVQLAMLQLCAKGTP